MPGRAQQMTPGQGYDMAPSRFTVPLKVLQNKRALDLAFQKHIWTMQQNSARGAGKLAAGSEIDPEKVLAQAVELAKANAVDLNSPDGQQEFQSIYQVLLNQASGGKKGAMMAAGGITDAVDRAEKLPSVPEPVGRFDVRRPLPGYAHYGADPGSGAGRPLDDATAQRLLQRAGGDKEKARAMAKKLGYTF